MQHVRVDHDPQRQLLQVRQLRHDVRLRIKTLGKHEGREGHEGFDPRALCAFGNGKSVTMKLLGSVSDGTCHVCVLRVLCRWNAYAYTATFATTTMPAIRICAHRVNPTG